MCVFVCAARGGVESRTHIAPQLSKARVCVCWYGTDVCLGARPHPHRLRCAVSFLYMQNQRMHTDSTDSIYFYAHTHTHVVNSHENVGTGNFQLG